MQEKVELFILTLFLSGASLLISQHGWRIRWIYFFISLMFGFAMGFIANNTPALEDWDYVINGIATLLAPAILLWLRGKTLDEVIEDVSDIKERLNTKKNK